MTWKIIDEEMRRGSVLYWSKVVGPWLENLDGVTRNVNMNSARAILRRDLLCILRKDRIVTIFRHKSPIPWEKIFEKEYKDDEGIVIAIEHRLRRPDGKVIYNCYGDRDVIPDEVLKRVAKQNTPKVPALDSSGS